MSIDSLDDPLYRIGGINGINTTPDQVLSHIGYLNQFIPNRSIEWVSNKTHGIFIDLLEVFGMNYLGYSPNTSKGLVENWTQFHKDNQLKPAAKYLQFCHSQGAIHMKNALVKAAKEIRERVIVVAIAPAVIIPRELCYQSFNYTSKRDIVPYGELLASGFWDSNEIGVSNQMAIALENRKQLILLDPHPDAKGIDHDFQSPTFKEIIQRHINLYLEPK